jgi:hypothetical protein
MNSTRIHKVMPVTRECKCVSIPRQVRTDSESYLISVYRCPTRLPTREAQKAAEEEGGEEEGEEQQQQQLQLVPGEGTPYFPPEGFPGPEEAMWAGPGLRRKKLNLEQKEKTWIDCVRGQFCYGWDALGSHREA